MHRPEIPCQFCCANRSAECHKTCKAYIEYEDAHKKYHEYVLKQRLADDEILDVIKCRFKK